MNNSHSYYESLSDKDSVNEYPDIFKWKKMDFHMYFVFKVSQW